MVVGDGGDGGWWWWVWKLMELSRSVRTSRAVAGLQLVKLWHLEIINLHIKSETGDWSRSCRATPRGTSCSPSLWRHTDLSQRLLDCKLTMFTTVLSRVVSLVPCRLPGLILSGHTNTNWSASYSTLWIVLQDQPDWHTEHHWYVDQTDLNFLIINCTPQR